jgi:hypothetical protein
MLDSAQSQRVVRWSGQGGYVPLAVLGLRDFGFLSLEILILSVTLRMARTRRSCSFLVESRVTIHTQYVHREELTAARAGPRVRAGVQAQVFVVLIVQVGVG